jgi:drug/metabolite transporter (DMT)-like permease
MIYLILCIIINAFIGTIFKLFEKYNIDTLQAIVVNYFVCITMAGLVNWEMPLPTDLMAQPWLIWAIVVGAILILVFNIIGASVKVAGVATTTVFQKMSLIAPTLVAILIYGESSSLIKWIGIGCSILAIIMMTYQPKNKLTKGSESYKLLILPILTFIGSCFVDLAFYFIDKKGLAPNGDIKFLATLFLVAGCIGFGYILYEYFDHGKKLALKNVYGGIFLGVPNFFSLYLIIISLQKGLEASIVFPVNNVGVLVLAAIFGFLFFKETFSIYKKVGFALAIIAIVLITLG